MQFHGMEDAILYASCFDANAGIFEALLGAEDAVISDELNHASIIDGVRLCKAQKARYKVCAVISSFSLSLSLCLALSHTLLQHRDLADLERVLQEAQGARARLIVSDGVFSMDGTVAPLKQIVALADKFNVRHAIMPLIVQYCVIPLLMSSSHIPCAGDAAHRRVPRDGLLWCHRPRHAGGM